MTESGFHSEEAELEMPQERIREGESSESSRAGKGMASSPMPSPSAHSARTRWRGVQPRLWLPCRALSTKWAPPAPLSVSTFCVCGLLSALGGTWKWKISKISLATWLPARSRGACVITAGMASISAGVTTSLMLLSMSADG